MAGIGGIDVVPLAAPAAQPLVTSVAPAVNPDSVSLLVDAFRKGAIGMADIQDRIGAEAQAQKRAHIEQLQEYVSPDAIQARMAQHSAAGATAQLQTAQAGAQAGLVQPMAESALQDIIQKNETRYSAPAVAAYTQFNPPIYKVDSDGNPTGEYDVQAMSREGSRYVRAQSMLQLAADGLKATPVKMTNPKTGAPVDVWLNTRGEDVTPVAGNKAYEFYNQMRRDAYEVFHEKADTTPHVEPVKNSEGKNVLPQDAAPSGMIRSVGAAPDVAPLTAAPSAPDVIAQQTGIPATVTAAPAPAPAAINTYLPYQGMPTGFGAQVWDKKDIVDELGKDKIYENWAQTRAQAANFIGAANAINSMPKNANFNPQDVALAEALIKSADPQGVVRSFKWDKFEEHQPLLDKLKAYQNYALGKGSFTPETRQALIALGKQYIHEREESVRPVLALAAKRAATNPALNGVNEILHPGDIDTLNGKSIVSQITGNDPASGSASVPTSRTVVIPGFPNGVNVNH